MNEIMENFIQDFCQKIKEIFQERVVFLGLQGSVGRGESVDTSDIDLVVILDQLEIEDLVQYRNLIDQTPEPGRMCGFISGVNELYHWEKSDLFQFYYDSQPIFGSIDFIKSMLSKMDVRRAVLIGACNIYHSCGHNFVHEKSGEILKSCYKSASFVLQAKYFDQTGSYVQKKTDLLPHLSPDDHKILEILLSQKSWNHLDEGIFHAFSAVLLHWAGKIIEAFSIK